MEQREDRTIVSERTLLHPRERVFRAWTAPEELRMWWGPRGFSNHFHEFDLRPEGTWRFIMRGPDGVEYPNLSRFVEILPQERIVFDHVNGPRFRAVVRFTDDDRGTHIHWTMAFGTGAEYHAVRSVVVEANQQNFDRLEAFLDAPPLVIERTMAAPVALVWSALTNAERMKNWYFDIPGFRAEPGFQFSFAGGPPGRTYNHLCEVKEVLPEQRLTHTWRYEGIPGNSQVTFELFAEGEQTVLRLTHGGLGTFPADNPDLARGNFVEGWSAIIGTSLPAFIARRDHA